MTCPPPATSARPPRRSVLAGAAGSLASLALAAAGSAACEAGRIRPLPTPSPSDPDAALRSSALAAEEALLAAHLATLRRHPGLGQRLGPLLDEHRAHLAALAGTGPGAPSGTPRATGPDDTAAVPATPAAPEVPADPAQAVRALAAAEAAAADARVVDALAVRDGRLARLLAAVGAAEATHSAALGPAR